MILTFEYWRAQRDLNSAQTVLQDQCVRIQEFKEGLKSCSRCLDRGKPTSEYTCYWMQPCSKWRKTQFPKRWNGFSLQHMLEYTYQLANNIVSVHVGQRLDTSWQSKRNFMRWNQEWSRSRSRFISGHAWIQICLNSDQEVHAASPHKCLIGFQFPRLEKPHL